MRVYPNLFPSKISNKEIILTSQTSSNAYSSRPYEPPTSTSTTRRHLECSLSTERGQNPHKLPHPLPLKRPRSQPLNPPVSRNTADGALVTKRAMGPVPEPPPALPTELPTDPLLWPTDLGPVGTTSLTPTPTPPDHPLGPRGVATPPNALLFSTRVTTFQPAFHSATPNTAEG
ncbi:hypothetical protein HOY82DRAFT_535481 [Tuber indicum]|nr:hypothetical protein HOY82DRAFT_535481 [Tuber indicum]